MKQKNIVGTDGSIRKEKLLEQCNFYLKLFDIAEKDLLKDSYSDQLLKKSSTKSFL